MYAYDTKSLVHIVVRRYTHSITLYYSEQVRTLILSTDYGSSALKVACLSTSISASAHSSHANPVHLFLRENVKNDEKWLFRQTGKMSAFDCITIENQVTNSGYPNTDSLSLTPSSLSLQAGTVREAAQVKNRVGAKETVFFKDESMASLQMARRKENILLHSFT